MRDLLWYLLVNLWKSFLGFALGILLSLLILQRCDKQKSYHKPPAIDSIQPLKQKVDTLLIKVTEVQDRVIPSKKIYLHDTTLVFQQLLTRDTIIKFQDSVILLQDTIIQRVEYADSVKSDSIVLLTKSVKRERFWKKVFRGAIPAAFLAGKIL